MPPRVPPGAGSPPSGNLSGPRFGAFPVWLQRELDPLVLRHHGEMPHRVEFKPQRIRHPGAVFAVRLVEQRTLTELNVLLRITEVSGDVGDEMRFILVAEHTAVKFAGLLEVDVLRIDVVARDTA